MSDELKPCPYCGAMVQYEEGTCYVACSECPCAMSEEESAEWFRMTHEENSTRKGKERTDGQQN